MHLKNVRTQFLAILLPLFIFSFSILSGISYYVTNRVLVENMHDIAAGIGEKVAAQIDKRISEKMIRLNELANNTALMQGDEQTKIAILAEAKKRSPEFDMVCYTDINGQAINETGKKMDRASREYIKKVRETKQPYISNPSISGSNGNLIVILTQPVLENGMLTGFVYGTISLETLSKTLQDVTFAESGYAYLVDSSGLVIGHGKLDGIAGKMDLTKKEVEGIGTLDDALMQGFRDSVDSRKQMTFYYKTTRGVDSIGVVTPIELEGRFWTVTVAAPRAEIEASANMLFRTLVGASVFFILLAVLILYVVAKRIASPVEAIDKECAIMNSGDLSRPDLSIGLDNEIGHLAAGFNAMRHTLRSLLEKVQSQSEQVSAASQQLTASAHQSAQAAAQVAASVTAISTGTEKQSSAVDRIAGLVEGSSQTALHISQKAAAIADVAENTTETAENGRGSIAKAVAQMQKISEGAAAVQSSIAELAKGSQEINNIVELISSIAGQTNLLALNAAIEAARAGAAGKGFAVVADEVRKLAEESNESSRKIGALVMRNQADMEKAIQASRAGAEGVQMGIAAVEDADGTFRSIVAAVDNLSQEISAISKAISELAENSAHMLGSIREIDDISKSNADEAQSVSAATQEQSAAMEEIASASQSLANLAGDLQQVVSKFKV